MYRLDSTHGLRTTAHTADQALAILGQHLTDVHRDGVVEWLITGPQHTSAGGYLDITTTPRDEAVDSIHQALELGRQQLTAGAGISLN